MKFIQKVKEPEVFTEWKESPQRVSRTWRTLNNHQGGKQIKRILKQSLLEEQGFICCYCERRITENSESSHIEHLKPKGIFPYLDLDYKNLLCSCLPEEKNEDSCGHKKDNWFDEELFVSPLTSECEEKITYSSSGNLEGADEASKTTIEKLGLNNYDLVRSRKFTIDYFCKNKYTKDNLKEILLIKEGKYHPFHTSIIQFFSIL